MVDLTYSIEGASIHQASNHSIWWIYDALFQLSFTEITLDGWSNENGLDMLVTMVHIWEG
jgi:hypothetical protein